MTQMLRTAGFCLVGALISCADNKPNRKSSNESPLRISGNSTRAEMNTAFTSPFKLPSQPTGLNWSAIVTPPMPTDAPAIGLMHGRKRNPQIGFDGTNFLAVWQAELGDSGTYVVGARFATDGTAVDPSAKLLGPKIGTSGRPALAYNGTHYLLAWTVRALGGLDGSPLRAHRLLPDGTVVDSVALELGSTVGDQPGITAASAGGDFVVAWVDDTGKGTSDIFVRRISAGGAILDGAAVPVDTTATLNSIVPRLGVAATTNHYMLAWEDRIGPANYTVFSRRLSTNGNFLDGARVAVQTGLVIPASPDVGHNGTDFLIAWLSGTGFHATRITDAGVVLDAPPISMPTLDDGGTPNISAVGSDFFVVSAYTDGPTAIIKSRRVSAAGILLDNPAVEFPTTILSADLSASPLAVGPASDRILVTVPIEQDTHPLIARRINAQNVVLDGADLSLARSANWQGVPSIAYGNGEALVVFADFRSETSFDVYGLRVADNGTAVGAPFPIAVDAETRYHPRVAFNGTNYLVTWLATLGGQDGYLRATRVSQTGTLLDSPPIAVTADFGHHEQIVVSNGTDFLVGYATGANNGQLQIRGVRVDATGNALDTPALTVLGQSSAYDGIRAASNGSDYLMTWQDSRAGGTDKAYAARITSAGAVQDLNGFEVGDSSVLMGTFSQAPVAFGDGVYTIVMPRKSGILDTAIYARQYDSAGVALAAGEFPVFAASGLSFAAEVTFDGNDFVAAWIDNQNSSLSLPAGTALYGARITSAGAILDPIPEVIAQGEGLQLATLAGNGSGGTVLGAMADDLSAGVVHQRVRLSSITWTAGVLGQACTGTIDCGGGDCVDGVCCDSVCGNGDPNDCQACSIAAGATTDGICAPLVAATQCRAAVNDCDTAEVCDGTATACPTDAAKANGANCEDGDLCSENDTCQAGTCTSGTAKTCTALSECHQIGVCTGGSGLCSNPPVANGTGCSLGSCVNGVCTNTPPPVDAGVPDATIDASIDAGVKSDATIDGPVKADATTDTLSRDATVVPAPDFKDDRKDLGGGKDGATDGPGNEEKYLDGGPGNGGGEDVDPGEGCDCRVAASPSGAWPAFVLLAVLGVFRRRRRSGSSS